MTNTDRPTVAEPASSRGRDSDRAGAPTIPRLPRLFDRDGFLTHAGYLAWVTAQERVPEASLSAPRIPSFDGEDY